VNNVLKPDFFQRQSRMEVYSIRHPITFIELWNLDTETKVYKKARQQRQNSWDAQQDHRKNEYALEELNVDTVGKKH
jgi:hypothetical protein